MQQSRLFLMSSGQSSSTATECTRPLLEAWCQMGDLWCFRDTMSKGPWRYLSGRRAQRARRCWRVLAKWQFQKATISTWAQVEATSSPLRVLLVKRAKVRFNKIVALMLRGPGLQLLHGARFASSARAAKCASGQKWSSASERRKLSCGETARARWSTCWSNGHACHRVASCWHGSTGGGETPLEELDNEKEQATCILKNRSE